MSNLVVVVWKSPNAYIQGPLFSNGQTLMLMYKVPFFRMGKHVSVRKQSDREIEYRF